MGSFMASTAPYTPRAPNHAKPAFHKPHTSLGTTAHFVRTAGLLAPLIIGEFVKDADKRWRYIRLASIGTALISEGMWTNKIRKERQEARECEALASMPM